MGLAIISSLLFVLARGPSTLFAGRLLGGLAVGAFLGTSNTLLLSMTTPDRRDQVMGFSSTLNLFGFGLGPALGGIWMRYLPGDPMRAPFVVLAVTLAAALLTLLTIRPSITAAAAQGKPIIRMGIPANGRALFWGVVGPAIFTSFAFGGLAFALHARACQVGVRLRRARDRGAAHIPHDNGRLGRAAGPEADRLPEQAGMGLRNACHRKLGGCPW